MKFPKPDFKKKLSSVGEAALSKMSAAKKVTAMILAVSLVLAIGFIAAPTVRKNSALGAVGDTVMTEMKFVPELLSYYDGNQISALSANPADNSAYRLLSDALATVRVTGGYDSVMYVVQSGKQYLCAADSLLDSGFNAYAAGSLLSPDKSVKTLLGKIYGGKSEGGVASDVIDSRMGLSSACVLIPVKGADGAVAGVLAIETGVKGAPFHMVGEVNLYVVGAIFAFVALVAALMLFMFIKVSAKTAADSVGTAAGVAAATVAAKTADAAMKKAVESRVKKAAEKSADAENPTPEAPKPEERKAPVSAAEVANAIFGRKSEEKTDEVDADEPVVPSLTLPGEDENG